VTNIMKSRIWQAIFAVAAVTVSSLIIWAQGSSTRAPLDITDYKIAAEVLPDTNTLKVTADVTVIPLQETRSLAFELNGSLKVESVTRERGFSTLPAAVVSAPAQSTTADAVCASLRNVAALIAPAARNFFIGSPLWFGGCGVPLVRSGLSVPCRPRR